MPLEGAPLTVTVRLADLLATGLAAGADRPALIGADDRWTWRRLEEASSRLAGTYLDLGLAPGDRVASLMPNRTVLVVHYLACIKAGLVATPLNYRYTAREIDHALEVSRAALLLAHAERDQDLAGSRLAGTLPRGIIRFAAEGDGARLEELMERTPTTTALPAPEPAAPASIFFTSGSTGLPKGVTHTRATTEAMLSSIIQGLGLAGGDVVLPGSSFSHQGGFSFSIGALGAGARVVVPRTMDAGEMLPLMREQRPTFLWMLPAALITLIREHDAHREDFASLRLCLSGGDKVSAELEREFTDLSGLAIDEGYGMTEFGCATVNPPGGLNKLGSVGRTCPGFSLSIRDEAGGEVAPGEPGRLWAKSPANTIGYWDRPDATAETIQDGWLDTGDLMRADADGYLWFCGRKKQIIIHDGSNISPQEVEEALMEHEAVQSAGVVGIHDLVHGETVRAYITLREGAARPTSQELIEFARARVGYKAPETIVILDQMPLNATGKVDRVTLKKMAEPEVPRP